MSKLFPRVVILLSCTLVAAASIVNASGLPSVLAGERCSSLRGASDAFLVKTRQMQPNELCVSYTQATLCQMQNSTNPGPNCPATTCQTDAGVDWCRGPGNIRVFCTRCNPTFPAELVRTCVPWPGLNCMKIGASWNLLCRTLDQVICDDLACGVIVPPNPCDPQACPALVGTALTCTPWTVKPCP
jgi:hypothetical protein